MKKQAREHISNMIEAKNEIKPLINTMNLYRMPWTLSDNAFTWLEITRRCDLSCGYCYQSNDPHSDKPLDQIEKEVKTLLRLRRCDAMIISGGEPLVHPQLDQIVKLVKSFRFVAGIDIFRAPAIMNASYFMNGILLTLSR